MPRSTRTLVAIILWVAAAFMVINNVTTAAPLGDWWLAILLVIIGLALWFLPDGNAATSAEIDAHDSLQMNTEKRTDSLAASVPSGDATQQDPVENISTDAGVTLEDTGEVSGPPGASISHETPEPTPARTPVSTPAPTPAPAPAAVHSEALNEVEAVDEAMTEERSDEIAAESEPSAEEQVNAVENINTDPTATLEETGEVSGPPGDSISHEEPEAASEPAETEDQIEEEYEAHSTFTAEGEIVGTVNVTGNRESVTRKDDARIDPEIVGITEVDESKESTTVEEKEAAAPHENTDAPPDPNAGADDDPDIPSEPVSDDDAKPAESLTSAPDDDADIPGELVSDDAQPAQSETSEPDNLKRVEGIGPKMSRALIASGIDTFAKLSNASEDEIRAAIDAAGMRFAPSVPTWAKQAEFAANGDWDGLAAYQSTLSSGREVSE